jgi:transposase
LEKDFARIWNDPNVPALERKRIIAYLIEDVTLIKGEQVALHIRFKGGKTNSTIYHLPPYSPNLNPIERLWKIMNERVRNNKVFRSAKEFRQEIIDFFKITWAKIAMSMTSHINDNFQILKQAS